jgi:hypothetical protein
MGEDVAGEILAKLSRLDERVAEVLGLLADRPPAKARYTTAEVAGLLGKAEYTVREWCRHGRIRAEKRACGRGCWASPTRYGRRVASWRNRSRSGSRRRSAGHAGCGRGVGRGGGERNTRQPHFESGRGSFGGSPILARHSANTASSLFETCTYSYCFDLSFHR